MAENKMKKNSCHSERYATTARQLRSCVSESESKEMLKQVQHDNFVESHGFVRARWKLRCE